MDDEQIWQDNLTDDIAGDRAENIAREIRKIWGKKSFKELSILEITSGNCEVMDKIHKMLPDAHCVASDIRDIRSSFVDCYFLQIPIQEFIRQGNLYDYLRVKPHRINFVIILYSYRHWDDGELKDEFDKWIKNTADYFITSFDPNDNGLDDRYESREKIGLDSLLHNLYICKVKQ
jgi:hypothetical protein